LSGLAALNSFESLVSFSAKRAIFSLQFSTSFRSFFAFSPLLPTAKLVAAAALRD
jgi:hypothetical protein